VKKIIGIAGLVIIVLVAWLALQNQATALISPSGRFLVEVCEQANCKNAVTATVLTAPHKGFVAVCDVPADAVKKLASAGKVEWLEQESVLKFAGAEIQLRYDCGAPERLPSPSGNKVFVVNLNCLFSLDEQQVCRRSLSLEKQSKDGSELLSFDCEYPLNQFDWDRIANGEVVWNKAEDDLEWPLKADSQFARSSGDDSARISIPTMCGPESLIY